jgi:hypothetical protein
VYNNESPNRTFHPKVYIFEKVGQRGLVFVGSSNLTAGGLYTNYEANIYSEYDLGNQAQADKFAAVKQMFEAYSTPSEFCKILTSDYLQVLNDNGYLAREASRTNQRSEDEEEVAGAETTGERLFGSARLHPPSVVRPTVPRPRPRLSVPLGGNAFLSLLRHRSWLPKFQRLETDGTKPTSISRRSRPSFNSRRANTTAWSSSLSPKTERLANPNFGRV